MEKSKLRSESSPVQYTGKFKTEDISHLIQENVKEISKYLDGIYSVCCNILTTEELLKKKDLLELLVKMSKVQDLQASTV